MKYLNLSKHFVQWGAGLTLVCKLCLALKFEANFFFGWMERTILNFMASTKAAAVFY